MPRRSILSATERDNLMALPEGEDDLIRHYSFTESDLSLIRQRRGDANSLGFAVQLCLLRYPGYAMANDMPVPDPVIDGIARQIRSDAAAWSQYGARDETRREHFQELRAYLSLSAFGLNLTGDYVWRQNRKVDEGQFDRYESVKILNVLFFPFPLFSPSTSRGAS